MLLLLGPTEGAAGRALGEPRASECAPRGALGPAERPAGRGAAPEGATTRRHHAARDAARRVGACWVEATRHRPARHRHRVPLLRPHRGRRVAAARGERPSRSGRELLRVRVRVRPGEGLRRARRRWAASRERRAAGHARRHGSAGTRRHHHAPRLAPRVLLRVHHHPWWRAPMRPRVTRHPLAGHAAHSRHRHAAHSGHAAGHAGARRVEPAGAVRRLLGGRSLLRAVLARIENERE